MFWITIGSNTNLHLTLINIFSVALSILNWKFHGTSTELHQTLSIKIRHALCGPYYHAKAIFFDASILGMIWDRANKPNITHILYTNMGNQVDPRIFINTFTLFLMLTVIVTEYFNLFLLVVALWLELWLWSNFLTFLWLWFVVTTTTTTTNPLPLATLFMVFSVTYYSKLQRSFYFLNRVNVM